MVLYPLQLANQVYMVKHMTKRPSLGHQRTARLQTRALACMEIYIFIKIIAKMFGEVSLRLILQFLG